MPNVYLTCNRSVSRPWKNRGQVHDEESTYPLAVEHEKESENGCNALQTL